MNIIAVDDEEQALALLGKAIQKALPGEAPTCFSTAGEAFSYAKQTPVDIAFLDIHLGSVSGLELAKELAKIKPDTNIIFVTGHGQYMDQAYELYVSGYVHKPVRVARIQKEVAHLRYPVGGAPRPAPLQSLGPYTFERAAQRIYRDGVDLLLTQREYAIFELLAGSTGTYFTPNELYARVFGQSANDELGALYTHISRLRKKLGLDDTGAQSGIDMEQQRGRGYRLVIKSKKTEAKP